MQQQHNFNKKFRNNYDKIFKLDPVAANILLLLAELSDKNGQIRFDRETMPTDIDGLLSARFIDCSAYNLDKGGRR